MPWIQPQYLECAVYLYPSKKHAEESQGIGGSGFVVGIDIGKPGADYVIRPQVLCVVTNKHVIDEIDRAQGIPTVRLNTVVGGASIVELDRKLWCVHEDGDDVAVCPIPLNFMYKAAIFFTPSRILLTKKLIEEFEIGPGDDVFVIGRFVNHEGKQRNLPSVRFGNIAQMPWEPIDFDGLSQESFLVEARSIAGYSGSPVFVYLPPPPFTGNLAPQARQLMKERNLVLPGVSEKRINYPFLLGPWLLGIDFCHLHRDEPIRHKKTKEHNPDWVVRSNTGMTGVVPAWKLAEILDGPRLKPLVDEYRARIANIPDGEAIDHNTAGFGKFLLRPTPASKK